MAYRSIAAAPGAGHGCLGSPGIWVYDVCRPHPELPETLASCPECRCLVTCVALGHGPDAVCLLWVPWTLERIGWRKLLEFAGCDAGQRFAPPCPVCDEGPHGRES
jgi:hypothetical protein